MAEQRQATVLEGLGGAAYFFHSPRVMTRRSHRRSLRLANARCVS